MGRRTYPTPPGATLQGCCTRRSVSSRTGRSHVVEAGVQFARAEGILPAPESNHAIRVAIDEALAAREEDRGRVILFNLSGHGHFDMSAYEAYLAGGLQDFEYEPLPAEAAVVAA